MKPSKSESRRRNRQLIARFAERAVRKNDEGIAKYGGGLQTKDTTEEIAKEILDLMNYWVEHEQQVKRLVEAATVAVEWYKNLVADIPTELEAALAPFLNEATKGND